MVPPGASWFNREGVAVADVTCICQVLKGIYYESSVVSVIIKKLAGHFTPIVYNCYSAGFSMTLQAGLVMCMHVCIYLQTYERIIIMKPEEMQFYMSRVEALKALANPYRLWMAEKLSEGELCVCEFNNALDLDYSTISRHLSVLRKAGIVEYRKSGKQVYYSLRTPCILGFLNCFDEVIKMNVQQGNEYLSAREQS